jgi:transglutaminase-like putative cysteine protease
MSTLAKRDRLIPRRPLLWLAAALLFTLPPFFETLAPWVPTLLLLTIAAKFWMEPRGYQLRLAALKLLLAALGLGAIFWSYGAIEGLEPGVSLVVVMMSLKILEAHTAREFNFMVMLGLVLCLCGFFLVQDLAPSLCLLLAFALLLAALVQFHRRSSGGGVWPPLRTACVLVAQAIPLTVLLFLLFPRVTTGFRLLAPSSAGAVGFSDRLSPGSIAALATSNAVAFRVEFPDGKIPPLDQLYWRGLVMSECDGMEWRAPNWPATNPHLMVNPPPAESIRQWITIEQHGGHWMFALDWPANAPPGAMLAPGNYLWSWQAITKSRRYEVTSVPRLVRKELRPRERQLMLEVPATISPAVRELAQSWVVADSQPRSIVNRALKFFQEGFSYSLTPGEYKKNDLEEFLLHRRVGFCEHYAGSFATLLRLAGVPARVVVGYLGGEWNTLGRFFLVRQSDTHAWCEVWLPENGWTRVDPTSVVAPERVSSGLAAFLERSASARGTNTAFTRTFAQQPVFARIRLAWQTLNYVWDTRVMSFDADAQQELFTGIGFSKVTPLTLLFWSLIITAVIVTLMTAWMHFRARARPDPVKLLYAQFCRKAARLGATRHPTEGPLDFSNRAARFLPEQSERIRLISTHYVNLRYSPNIDAFVLQQLAREVELFSSEKASASTHHSLP